MRQGRVDMRGKIAGDGEETQQLLMFDPRHGSAGGRRARRVHRLRVVAVGARKRKSRDPT